MIDQASVFTDRFRNNRQALQAAVLGQNSGVDPYTALRALQLLKESDSMQVAQQGQQPTEAPSLLQEAMQPPQMPMGMAVPGQQMSQAPQQNGGLEAMPVPEQDFADGGIIAFAEGDSIPGPKDVKERWQDMKRRPDETPTEFLRRVEAAKQKDFQAQGPAKFKQSLEEALKENKQNMREGMGAAVAKLRENEPLVPGLGARPEGMEREAPVAEAPVAEGEPGSRENPFVPAGSIQSDAMHNRRRAGAADERALFIEDEREGEGEFDPNAFLSPADTPPTAGGLSALAAPTFNAASRERLDAALDAQAAFTPTESTITPPRGLEAKIKDLKGEKGSLAALKGLFGDDKASTKAQALLNKRLKELEDPDRNKFEKALGFFKAAGALQKTIDKDGRRVTPMGAAAEAMGEVASVYSGIRKEDRKAKQLIEDSQMALDKAAQARKDGLTSKAFDLETQADKDKTAAETLQANINARKDQARATVLAATTTAEGSAYRGDQQAASQVYASELSRLSAQERNATNERMRKLTAQGQVDSKNLAAYNAAYATLMRTEANVDKAMKDDTDLQSVISRISLYERRAAKNELDKKDTAALENYKAKRAQLEKKYTDRLKAATGPFNVISSRIMGAAGIGAGGIDQEAAARQWLKNNPNAPQADAIRKELGM